jgi:hypothetical protein
MNLHPENQSVEIAIPFQDRDGAPVKPTEISARLFDGEDTFIAPLNGLAFDPVGVEVRITIPARLNELHGDELQEVRVLKVLITHEAGTVEVTHVYGIEAEQPLQIMENSFMTYETALMTGAGFVNLVSFNSDTDQRRRAALVEAYRRITSLAMIFSVINNQGKSEGDYRISPATWHYVTPENFASFPSHFRRALRHAQVAEADEILQGNVVARKHAQGIASETIGESSVTLREGFAGSGSTGLSAACTTILSGYLDTTIVMGRA